nr:metal-dependent transcriptional regulator [Aeoliella straminimaris]
MTLTVENYLKAIFQLSDGQQGTIVSTGQIADALGVSPGTVTSMLKTLADGSLATYKPYEGVELTPAGRAIALRVIRRHRLIELFLVDTLKLSWDEVHDEAENMEHAVSDWLVDRIDQHLGHPKVDPHGDPIPTADGAIPQADTVPLVELSEGQRFRVIRVLDQSPEILRTLSESGITLGVAGIVAKAHADGGRVIDLAGVEHHIDQSVAVNIGVDLLE